MEAFSALKGSFIGFLVAMSGRCREPQAHDQRIIFLFIPWLLARLPGRFLSGLKIISVPHGSSIKFHQEPFHWEKASFQGWIFGWML
jgi:hypothetical protein